MKPENEERLIRVLEDIARSLHEINEDLYFCDKTAGYVNVAKALLDMTNIITLD